MNPQDTMRLALEALETCSSSPDGYEATFAIDMVQEAIDALRTSLSQQVLPVAEVIECVIMGQQTVREIDGRWKFLPYGTKLYTSPTQQSYEQGIRDACEQFAMHDGNTYADMVLEHFGLYDEAV